MRLNDIYTKLPRFYKNAYSFLLCNALFVINFRIFTHFLEISMYYCILFFNEMCRNIYFTAETKFDKKLDGKTIRP